MSSASAADSDVVGAIESDKLVRRVFVGCVSVELLLVVLDYVFNVRHVIDVGALKRFSNITREDSLATFVASTQLLLVSAAAWLVSLRFRLVSREQNDGVKSTGWAILAAFFVYMAADEGAQIHERMGSTVHALLHEGGEAGVAALNLFPSYDWQVVLGPMFAGAGVFLVLFLWFALTDKSSMTFIFLGMACYVAAVLLDFAEGLRQLDPYAPLIRVLGATRYTVEHYSKVSEEFLEMLGTTFFLVTFTREFCRAGTLFKIRFR
ncbi:MAG: hypothetical protein ACE5I7_07270 [Candidatus Binatia bacterium]